MAMINPQYTRARIFEHGDCDHHTGWHYRRKHLSVRRVTLAGMFYGHSLVRGGEDGLDGVIALFDLLKDAMRCVDELLAQGDDGGILKTDGF